VGLELAEYAHAKRVSLDGLFVPCGGGGLIAGSGMAAKAAFPDCRVYAVEPAAYNDTALSLAAGSRQLIRGHPKTICDALMTPSPGAITFAINREILTAARMVTDAAAAYAVAFASRYLKVVLEPSGAVALASVLGGIPEGHECIGVILSGGNVDSGVLLDALSAYPDS
jgi:threonine dehydratase